MWQIDENETKFPKILSKPILFLVHLSLKFHENSFTIFTTFWVILSKSKKDRQTNQPKQIHNLLSRVLGGGN